MTSRATGLHEQQAGTAVRVLAASAATALAVRYSRDLSRSRARLASFDSRTAETSYGPVEYCEFGDGPPVLMVHGIVGGHDVGDSWRALVPAGYRIIAPSRFGYFGTPMPRGATPAMQADAFAALLDTLGIDRTLVFGFSAGSTSSVQLALRHANRVSALVLVCPNAPHPQPVRLPPRALGTLLFSQPAFWALRLFARPALERLAGVPAGYPLDEDVRHDIAAVLDGFFPLGPRTTGSVFDAFVGNPAIADHPVEAISNPALVVHAQDDPLARHDDAQAMAARIPGARFVSLRRGGHVLMHREPRARSEIASFLAACGEPVSPEAK